MKNILFLGGPGNISESAIRYFIKKGIPVGVMKRTRSDLFGLENDITIFYGDRNDGEALVAVLEKFEPDVIVDCTCFDLSQAKTVVMALKKIPCRRLLFISTADVYGYPLNSLPMHEDDVWNIPNCKYAEDKKAIEIFYRDSLEETGMSLTIIRPGYSLGKTFALTSFERNRGKYLVNRLRQGKPIYSPGDGTTLIDAGAAYNTGMMIARIAENDNTCGQDYNCANNRAVTYDEYIQAFADALGKPAQIVHVPTDFMFSLERKEVEESILNDLAKYNLYFAVDKFKAEFPDFVWEYSLSDAVKDFIAYQESIGELEKATDDQFEDRVVNEWLKAMDELRKKINTFI